MGRPPCCDKVGVKKGPWTPEEDIMLVSYVQEHGPANWRAVPATTGLRRCSKSCRLRWTNYLRPGIKRGSFTDHEEKMIVQLQALLGNKWAAIASYLPERTDNDIKNYWNTHLKKKLKKLEDNSNSSPKLCTSQVIKGQWERRLQADINTAKQALHDALTPVDVDDTKPVIRATTRTTLYASSTENIARLLKGWTKSDCVNVSSPDQNSSSTNNNAMNMSDLEALESSSSLFGLMFQGCEGSDDYSGEFSRSSTSSPGGDKMVKLEENGSIDDENDDHSNDLFTNFWLEENLDLF